MSVVLILFGMTTKATIVLLVGTVLSLALHRASAGSRMLLWNLVFASLLLSPVLTMCLPGWYLAAPTVETPPAMAPSTVAVTTHPVAGMHGVQNAQPPLGTIAITVWIFGVVIVLGRLLIGMLPCYRERCNSG